MPEYILLHQLACPLSYLPAQSGNHGPDSGDREVIGKVAFVLWMALVLPVAAQVPVDSETAPHVEQAFADLPKTNSLHCSIHGTRPNLDFSFRFYAGYIAECPLSQFGGKEVNLVAYMRVGPRDGAPVLLAESYHMAAMTPEELAKANPGRLRTIVELAGGFTMGEGEYEVQLLLMDDHHHVCHKRWSVKATRNREQRSVTLALPPHTASELMFSPWDGKLAARGGLRVTILLNAAPINPFESKLRPWDRAFLLESLTSVLRQTPCSSVRLAAFNLEQQKEFFRSDTFNSESFNELSHALRKLALGTVAYQVLQDRDGAARLITEMASREIAARQASDVVIFLGPTTRFAQKPKSELLINTRNGHPRFFYFDYYPWLGRDFPDAISHVTKTLHGTTYSVHSPGELGKSIQKMLAELKQE